jgi:acetoin utilization protein AcuB
MWVKNYMFKNVLTASPDTTVNEAVKKMIDNKSNSLIVVDEDNKPVGILSSFTLIKEVVPEYLKDPNYSQYGAEGTFERYACKVKEKKIKDVMHTDFHTLSEDDAIIEAASYSVEAARRIMPVVNKEGKLIGAMTRTCIKNALFNAFNKECQIDSENGGCSCCGKHD